MPPPRSSNALWSGLVTERGGIARAAMLIALGNIASRILGLVRDQVISHLFGATEAVSALRAAEYLPRQVYDLLIGGMVSSALVPIFSEYADKDRQTLWQIASIILSLTTLLLGSIMLILLAGASALAWFLGGTEVNPLILTPLLRLTTPAMLFLSLSGVLTGLLHGLKRFVFPAFTAATFNAAIIIVTLVGFYLFDFSVEVVAVGMVIGSVLQVLIQLPGLSRAKLRFQLDLHHPVLRRIGKLYQPIALGLVVTFMQTALDRRLANSTGESSLAWMQNATTLIQFPMGLIVLAVSLAILPTLSRYATEMSDGSVSGCPSHRDGDRSSISQGFVDTLFSGLKIVFILVVPATVALFILAEPIINLLFEHGAFTAEDTRQTALALRYYLLGLIFAAIDQPLVFAFYARQNTFTPAMVGIASVGVYLLFALGPLFFRPLEMTDLVLADSLKHLGHVILMLWLIRGWGNLLGQGLVMTAWKTSFAAVIMGLCLWYGQTWFVAWLPPTSLVNEILMVGSLSLSGGLIYVGLIWGFRVEEIHLLGQMVRRKISGATRRDGV